jgi:malonyl-CoA/methylmalonyl-CoA synthetase
MGSAGNSNLYSCFRRRFPTSSKVLLTTGSGESFTYGDAEQRSAQVANALVELGLEVGDRVSVQVEKSPESLWLYLGIIRAGMVYHPLNPAYTDDELGYFLGDAGPSLFVCGASRAQKLQGLCDKAGVPSLHTLNADGTGSLVEAAQRCSVQFDTVESAAGDLAALLYSSGTTGRPKGIMLTHGNLLENAVVLVDYWGFTGDDCLLHVLPVFHVHGLFVAIGCVLMSGASMRWLPKFDVPAVLGSLPLSTVMMGVPTYYTRLLGEPSFGADSCKSIRLFISGSAPLLPDTFVEFEQRTGQVILERYGMSETGMNTSNPLDGPRRAGTVGLPLPGVTVRVCGADNRVLASGEVGDLQVKGGNVFAGYWNMPDKTAEDFTPDGFFVTGDKGLVDEDGYISIVGRSKDMVISGGLNVYPRELELLIDELPGVLESAVIGLPDPDFGEAVAAVVVLEEGAQLSGEGIRNAVKQQAANFKVPKQVFFVASLPRNTMGKVQKNVLRQNYA